MLASLKKDSYENTKNHIRKYLRRLQLTGEEPDWEIPNADIVIQNFFDTSTDKEPFTQSTTSVNHIRGQSVSPDPSVD